MYKPPEVKLKALTLVLALQTGSSGTGLVGQGHLQGQHKHSGFCLDSGQIEQNSSLIQSFVPQHFEVFDADWFRV